MAIKFKCTSCEKVLAVKDELAGKKIKCPGCKAVTVVPASGGAAKAEVKAAPTPPKPAAPAAPKSTPVSDVPKITVKCEACNSTFNGIAWKPAWKCMGCGSTMTSPAVQTDETNEFGSTATSRTKAKSKKDAKAKNTKAKKPKKAKRVKSDSDDNGGWKRNPIVGVVLVLMIFGLWGQMLTSSCSGPPRPPIDMMCNSCDAVMYESIPKGGQPWDCPECNKKELYRAMKCADCATKLPIIMPVAEEIQMDCPKCSEALHSMGMYPPAMMCNTEDCGYQMYYQSYYCGDCKHTWNVLPDKDGNLDTPEKCPECKKEEKLIPLDQYMPECPECKSTRLELITPIKKDKKKKKR